MRESRSGRARMRGIVHDFRRALCVRAMRAAVERSVRFDTVADDLAVAMVADRCKLLNCALEAVERMGFSGCDDLKRHRVVIPAYFAYRHFILLRWPCFGLER